MNKLEEKAQEYIRLKKVLDNSERGERIGPTLILMRCEEELKALAKIYRKTAHELYLKYSRRRKNGGVNAQS